MRGQEGSGTALGHPNIGVSPLVVAWGGGELMGGAAALPCCVGPEVAAPGLRSQNLGVGCGVWGF